MRPLLRAGLALLLPLATLALAPATQAAAPVATVQADAGAATLQPAVGCITFLAPPGPGRCAALADVVRGTLPLSHGAEVRVRFDQPVALRGVTLENGHGQVAIAPRSVGPAEFGFTLPAWAPERAALRFAADWANTADRGDAYYGVQLLPRAPIALKRSGHRGRRVVVRVQTSRDGTLRLRWQRGGRTQTKRLTVKAATARTVRLALGPGKVAVSARLTPATGPVVTRSFTLRGR